VRLLAAAVGAALLLGGCTTGSVDDFEKNRSDNQVELAVDGYLAAVTRGDFSRACAKLTSSYARTNAGSSRKSCADFLASRYPSVPAKFEGQPLDAGSIPSLRWTLDTSGDSATLRSESRLTTFKLQKSGGDWKIVSIAPVRG
jgi:hypothetical protein